MFGKSPAVRMKFLGNTSILEGNITYHYYVMGVANLGNDLAENAWPQATDFSDQSGSEALLWGDHHKYPDAPSDEDFWPMDIPPGDETHQFVIFYVSSWDSQNNAHIATMPTARRGAPYPHTLIGVTPDESLYFSLTVSGDNFRCSKMRFRASLLDAGVQTWRTLQVVRWHFHSPVTWRAHRWMRRGWRWLSKRWS